VLDQKASGLIDTDLRRPKSSNAEMLKIPKGDEDLKLRNCSAGFPFFLRFELRFVFVRSR